MCVQLAMWRSGSAGGALEKVYPAPYRVAFKNTSVQKHYSLGGGATDVYMSSDKQDVACLDRCTLCKGRFAVA